MKKLSVLALCLCAGLALSGAYPTTTVTYNVVNPDGTYPATCLAVANVTYTASADPATVGRNFVGSYSSSTGVVTWTLPQNSQVRFTCQQTGLNEVVALGSAASYTLNALVPVSTPSTAPAYMGNYLLRNGTNDMSAALPLKDYATGSLPATADEGALAYDTTLNTLAWWTGAAWSTPVVTEADPLSLHLAGGTMSGNIAMSGAQTVDGVDISTIATTYLPLSGGTMTGDLAFEGLRADEFETTLTVSEPTADNTLTLPDCTPGTIWTSCNDGTGSGLDADLLDGSSSAAFATSGHNHAGTYLPLTGGTISDDLTLTGWRASDISMSLPTCLDWDDVTTYGWECNQPPGEIVIEEGEPGTASYAVPCGASTTYAVTYTVALSGSSPSITMGMGGDTGTARTTSGTYTDILTTTTTAALAITANATTAATFSSISVLQWDGEATLSAETLVLEGTTPDGNQITISCDPTADRVLTIPDVTGTVWTSGNDGAASGLDADTVDGSHASAFLTAEVDGVVGNEVTNVSGTTLTRSGAGTGGDPYLVALNLASANTWTAAQMVDGSADVTQFTVQGYAGQDASDYLIVAEDSTGADKFTVSAAGAVTAAESLGSEMVTNGGFATDTDWTKGTGWTISGDKATHAAGSSSTLSQAGVAPTAGLLYKITYTLDSISGGYLYTSLGSVTGPQRSTAGTFNEYVLATSVTALYFTAQSTADAVLDNVSVTLVSETSGAITAPVMAMKEIQLNSVDASGAMSAKITAVGNLGSGGPTIWFRNANGGTADVASYNSTTSNLCSVGAMNVGSNGTMYAYNKVVGLASDAAIGFSSTAAASATKDTGLARSAAGVVKVTNGSTGNGRIGAIGFVPVSANLTTDDVTPDVSAATVWKSVANGGATVLTDLDNPVVGAFYTIIVGSATNPISIADSSPFSLAGAWAPDSVGDNIVLYVNADNDYYEISRSNN